MKPVIPIIIILPIFLQALTTNIPLNNPILYEEQRKIYDAQNKEKKISQNIYTELQPIPLKEDVNASTACLRIDKITLENSKLIADEELDAVIKPYLHRCNSIQDINMIVKNINNLYIQKAYVTSRAYIKAQDMSKHKLTISTMEGKIEKVEGKDISTSLVFPYVEQSHLNLRDLEMGLEQLNRLQSVQATMDINPGTEVGYSNILIKGKKVRSAFHGSLGIDNYNTAKLGNVQITGSVGWDNPLDLNDLLTLNLNTTDQQDKDNNSIGNSLSYGLPIGRAYVKLNYFVFNYDQVVDGLNVKYDSEGKSEEYRLSAEYKVFHSKTQKGKVNIGLARKKNDNYLADVFLDTSSSKLTIAQLSYTHNYTAKSWNGYTTLRYHRGLDLFGATSPTGTEPTFDKLTLELNYNQCLLEGEIPVKYNFSVYGQYANDGILASEYIGIGGPYSVRGFENKSQLSGNKGFYIRNELTLGYTHHKFHFLPYIALDYGWVEENELSFGGEIAGTALGLRMYFYDFAVDIFTSKVIKDSNELTYLPNGDEVRKENDGFSGFTLSYRF